MRVSDVDTLCNNTIASAVRVHVQFKSNHQMHGAYVIGNKSQLLFFHIQKYRILHLHHACFGQECPFKVFPARVLVRSVIVRVTANRINVIFSGWYVRVAVHSLFVVCLCIISQSECEAAKMKKRTISDAHACLFLHFNCIFYICPSCERQN